MNFKETSSIILLPKLFHSIAQTCSQYFISYQLRLLISIQISRPWHCHVDKKHRAPYNKLALQIADQEAVVILTAPVSTAVVRSTNAPLSKTKS